MSACGENCPSGAFALGGASEDSRSCGLVSTLGVELVEVRSDYAEAVMPIAPGVLQPHGFVHGGATIALLETVASAGAQSSCDLACELPFGVEVSVRHRKSGRVGQVRGVARLDRTEPSRSGGVKQYWAVAAYDDAGDVMSDGTVMMKIVPRDYLAKRSGA